MPCLDGMDEDVGERRRALGLHQHAACDAGTDCTRESWWLPGARAVPGAETCAVCIAFAASIGMEATPSD